MQSSARIRACSQGWYLISKHPLISIPLDIPDLRVLQTELSKEGELILAVESTLNSTTCRRCGRTITKRHGADESRLLRHLPSFGRLVDLRIRSKRYSSPRFDDYSITTQILEVLQDLPWKRIKV